MTITPRGMVSKLKADLQKPISYFMVSATDFSRELDTILSKLVNDIYENHSQGRNSLRAISRSKQAIKTAVERHVVEKNRELDENLKEKLLDTKVHVASKQHGLMTVQLRFVINDSDVDKLLEVIAENKKLLEDTHND